MIIAGHVRIVPRLSYPLLLKPPLHGLGTGPDQIVFPLEVWSRGGHCIVRNERRHQWSKDWKVLLALMAELLMSD